MSLPPFRSAYGIRSSVGGTPSGPDDAFTALTNAPLPNTGVDWSLPLTASGAARRRPISNAFGNGEPPIKTDVSLARSTMGFIDHTFSCPSAGYDHVAEMDTGMLAFAVRRMHEEPGATLILTLHQVNRAMREQWDEFVTRTTPNGPYTDGQAQQFLAYMQRYGELGLGIYAHALAEQPSNKFVLENTDLQDYYTMALSDDFCYLTLFGIERRIKFVGAIVSTTRERTLDDMGLERDATTSSVVVGVGRRVEVTQIFGERHAIKDGSRLYLVTTRIPCDGGTLFGSFCIYPDGGTAKEVPLRMQRSFRDESGRECRGTVKFVGTVNRAPFKESSQFAITQATNTGAYIGSEGALHMHKSLPLMHVNVGIVF